MSATTAVQENPPGTSLPRAELRGYQYKHGDRPLDGYTLQRGAGRGGFGEVYYALSDSGREVALKLIQTYEQIELRGIGQCMNLKSPHLVTVFDVKYGNDTRPWVIMEYIAGPSLRQLLDAAPSGLGTQKAAFFLREIGKGLTYLHDCGIVHRDLKPANIFYENGYVKIGDYGLSKAISTSHHSGQTVTVGTVHYMAPEIGAGNYDRGIDIYALGALLFEMLTGQVPFFGASPTEILMKHLSAEPDVSAIEEPFKTVIRKAMAKNPTERYQSVQEMIEAVFGAEEIRNSVSVFSPDSLTMVAGHVAQKIPPAGGASGSFTPSDGPAQQNPPPWQCDRWGRMAGVMDNVGDRWQRKIDRVRAKMDRKRARWEAKFGGPYNPQTAQAQYAGPFSSTGGDPLRPWHRIVLASIAVFIVGLIGGVLAEHRQAPSDALIALVSTAGATALALFAWRFIAPALEGESPWMSRLAIGGVAGIAPILLTLPGWGERNVAGTALAVFVSFLLMDWRERLSALRPDRVVVGKLITAALLGFIFGNMFDGVPQLAITILVGTTVATGIAAPWNSRRQVSRPANPMSPPPIPQPAPTAVPIPMTAPPAAPNEPRFSGADSGVAYSLPPAHLRAVPRFVRGLWLALFCGFATLGMCLLVSLLAVRNGREDRALMFSFGTGAMAFAVLALRRGGRTHFTGFWEYFFRPVLQLLCVQSILIAGSMVLIARLRGDELIPAIFFIVFPSIILFVVSFVAGRGDPMTQAPALYPTAQFPPDRDPITLGGIVFGLSRFASNVLGSLILAFSLLVALAVVTDLPGLFESGVLDPNMPQQLDQNFGTHNWPRIMNHVGAAISFITAMIASGFLLVPRRRYGAFHMFRAIVAIGILFASMMALGHNLPDWGTISPGESVGSPGTELEFAL